MTLSTVLLWSSVALAVAGAAVAVLSRDVTRVVLGLGGFLLALAALYVQYGMGFLAVAQVFVYVGGVLVLMLFAIMMLHRSGGGVPGLDRTPGIVVALPAIGVFVVLAAAAGVSLEGDGAPRGVSVAMEELTNLLLGRMLPHFEIAGFLLLAALVAAVAISGGDES